MEPTSLGTKCMTAKAATAREKQWYRMDHRFAKGTRPQQLMASEETPRGIEAEIGPCMIRDWSEPRRPKSFWPVKFAIVMTDRLGSREWWMCRSTLLGWTPTVLGRDNQSHKL